MYKSPLFIRVFWMSIVIIIGFVYFISFNSVFGLIISFFICGFLWFYFKNLYYYFENDMIVRKTGTFLKRQVYIKKQNIVYLSAYYSFARFPALLVIGHFTNKSLIIGLNKMQIQEMLKEM